MEIIFYTRNKRCFNKITNQTIECCSFNGYEFKLYENRRLYYVGMGRNPKYKWLHVCIWEYYNGPIPTDNIYHVHHIDCNSLNNDISNLKLLTKSEHMSLHKKGKKHSDETNKKKGRSGELNIMSRKNVFECWIDRYGIEEANKRQEEQIKKSNETKLKNKILKELKIKNIR